jgi:carboxyl-terminal processing protease
MLFNFATQFRHTHPEIAPPARFELTQNDFADFISYLDSVGFEYESQTSALLKELKEAATKENYYTQNQPLFDSLEVAIDKEGYTEFELYKDEITKLIEEEIVGRYYLQRGKAKYNLNKDEVIEKCIEALANPNLSKQILSNNSGKLTRNNQATKTVSIVSNYVGRLTAQKELIDIPS